MGLLPNPMKMAKDALLKVNMNKNNVPDIFEALDAGEAALGAVADWLDDIDQAEALSFLTAANNFRKPEKRRSQAELAAVAAKFVAIPAALRAAEKALEMAEAELKKP